MIVDAACPLCAFGKYRRLLGLCHGNEARIREQITVRERYSCANVRICGITDEVTWTQYTLCREAHHALQLQFATDIVAQGIWLRIGISDRGLISL
jgi:hypothetical protein